MNKYKNESVIIERRFISSDELPEIIFCNICDEIYNNPMRLNCGHIFCLICLENCLKRSENCPYCKTKIIKKL